MNWQQTPQNVGLHRQPVCQQPFTGHFHSVWSSVIGAERKENGNKKAGTFPGVLLLRAHSHTTFNRQKKQEQMPSATSWKILLLTSPLPFDYYYWYTINNQVKYCSVGSQVCWSAIGSTHPRHRTIRGAMQITWLSLTTNKNNKRRLLAWLQRVYPE